MSDLICPKGCDMVERIMICYRSKYESGNPWPIKQQEVNTCPMCGYKWREVSYDECLEPI